MATWDKLHYVALLSLVYGITSVVATRCSSYCDDDGYFITAFHCYQPQSFCCGDHTFRYCCRNATSDISNAFPDVYMCPHSSWWLFHWQVALGMLGGVILLLMVAACCCKACLRNNPNHRRRGRRHTRRTTDRSERTLSTESTEAPSPIQVFNPDAPFAFEPPPYESLPKAPPKYSDVFGTISGGSDNIAFIPDMDDLPPYTVNDVSHTTPGTSTVAGVHQVTSGGQSGADVIPKENETEIFVTNVEMQTHGLNISPPPEGGHGGEGGSDPYDQKEIQYGSNV